MKFYFMQISITNCYTYFYTRGFVGMFAELKTSDHEDIGEKRLGEVAVYQRKPFAKGNSITHRGFGSNY